MTRWGNAKGIVAVNTVLHIQVNEPKVRFMCAEANTLPCQQAVEKKPQTDGLGNGKNQRTISRIAVK